MRQSAVLLLSLFVGVTGNGKALAASGNTPKSLQQAAVDCDVEQLKLHIAKGSNLNAQDQFGYTPLMRAIQRPSAEAAKLIIESGKADVNGKDRSGRTPLIVSASNGYKEIVELLLAHEADVKAKDNNDWTCLHSAVQFGQLDIIEMLVKKGADVNATAKTGQTPYTMALQQAGRPEIAELLKQNGGKEPQQASLYGDYPSAGSQAGPQGPVAAPRRPAIQIDPNAIQKQMKQFEGLAAALKTVDDKSAAEQRAWIQRRSDNRVALLAASEQQFVDEMAFVKPFAVEEKAEKTTKAIDDLVAKRKKRVEQIGEQLREQRRETAMQNRQSTTTGAGRAGARGARGRTPAAGAAGSAGYSAAGPYGSTATKTPARRPAEADPPAIDPNTQSQIQAWLNAKVDDKKSLLAAVHDQDLAELESLQQLAVKEKAMKTSAAIGGLMMVREQRIEKITLGWQQEDAKLQKQQERLGPGGMPPGRGMQGIQQQNQQGMRGRPTR
ncbi:MAG: ankyrin repeat domain-containing protein [Phycisphaerae bacterium]|nr:ankyrin repeat domain-containing protein [Phycisphaerae bacterium]